MNKNPWAHLGMGYSMSSVKFQEGKEDADVSPYIQLENIDPKWLEAIGYKGPAKRVREAQE